MPKQIKLYGIKRKVQCQEINVKFIRLDNMKFSLKKT